MWLASSLLINRLYRQCIELAPQCQPQLQALQNKIIVIEISNINQCWGLCLHDDEIQYLSPEQMTQFDVKISGSSQSFWALLRAQDKQQAMMSESFTIAGNTQTMMQLQQFLGKFSLDLEGLAAQYVGDIAAVQLYHGVQVGQQVFQDSLQSWQAAAKNYLHYESDWIVQADQIEDFSLQVRQLRDQTERLQARVLRLRQQILNKDAL